MTDIPHAARRPGRLAQKWWHAGKRQQRAPLRRQAPARARLSIGGNAEWPMQDARRHVDGRQDGRGIERIRRPARSMVAIRQPRSRRADRLGSSRVICAR